jgi:hypothetical protein
MRARMSIIRADTWAHKYLTFVTSLKHSEIRARGGFFCAEQTKQLWNSSEF